VASPAEVDAMRRAITAAQSADAPLGPNPRVGCVLLDSAGNELAVGHHRGAGTAHAEVDALAQAGPLAVGATAVVTLEPCSHVGRTGPCATSLIDAGITRVVIAQRDRTTQAAGGADRLRAAGVDVETGVLEDDARLLNPLWTTAVERGRPFVTWKLAATLDGRAAAADGSSRWITGSGARADVHRLRSVADVVMVGTGTALADDPHLTARQADGSLAGVQPLRVVVGNRTLPAEAALLDDAAPTQVFATHDVAQVLALLADQGRHHVLLEGGPTLAAALLRADLVDRVVAYVAPTLLGSGPNVLGDVGIKSIGAALRLSVEDVVRLGDDVRITATMAKGA
jgi:diaminohydroxyphosphoribosylaminopyrimidine deaminase / 5-amino-6-(5-phosphoribosylamino)uracil reductase